MVGTSVCDALEQTFRQLATPHQHVMTNSPGHVGTCECPHACKLGTVPSATGFCLWPLPRKGSPPLGRVFVDGSDRRMSQRLTSWFQRVAWVWAVDNEVVPARRTLVQRNNCRRRCTTTNTHLGSAVPRIQGGHSKRCHGSSEVSSEGAGEP